MYLVSIVRSPTITHVQLNSVKKVLAMKYSACIFHILLFAAITSGDGKVQLTIPQSEKLGTFCSPWFVYNNTTYQCECYTNPSLNGIVKCMEEAALVRLDYCTTYKKRSRVISWQLQLPQT